jgi:hypothetical protein
LNVTQQANGSSSSHLTKVRHMTRQGCGLLLKEVSKEGESALLLTRIPGWSAHIVQIIGKQ